MKKLYKLLITPLFLLTAGISSEAAIVKIYIDEEKNLFAPANATAQVGDTIQWRRLPGQTAIHELHSIWITSPDPEKSKYEYFFETDTLYTYKVESAGNYNIHCYPHGAIMKGTIAVGGLPTGINREGEMPEINFYPNPLQSVINLDFNPTAEWMIQINDINGREVKTDRLLSEENNQINLENLSPGIYTIHISDGRRIRKENFIKE